MSKKKAETTTLVTKVTKDSMGGFIFEGKSSYGLVKITIAVDETPTGTDGKPHILTANENIMYQDRHNILKHFGMVPSFQKPKTFRISSLSIEKVTQLQDQEFQIEGRLLLQEIFFNYRVNAQGNFINDKSVPLREITRDQLTVRNNLANILNWAELSLPTRKIVSNTNITQQYKNQVTRKPTLTKEQKDLIQAKITSLEKELEDSDIFSCFFDQRKRIKKSALEELIRQCDNGTTIPIAIKNITDTYGNRGLLDGFFRNQTKELLDNLMNSNNNVEPSQSTKHGPK